MKPTAEHEKQSGDFNADDIRRTFKLMRRLPGQVTEIRCLNTRFKTLSGYSEDQEMLVRMAVEANATETVQAVYFTPNACNRALIARSKDKISRYAKSTTADADI